MSTEKSQHELYIEGLESDLSTAQDRIKKLEERLQFDPGGSDKIDELESAMQFLRSERDKLQQERDAWLHQVDALCNLNLNIADTLRSRGFDAGKPLDERVIAMAQDRDSLQKELEEVKRERAAGDKALAFIKDKVRVDEDFDADDIVKIIEERIGRYSQSAEWFYSAAAKEQIGELKSELATATAENARLREALTKLLNHYLALANSGDAGNWNPEDEPEVIEVRALLSPQSTEPAAQVEDEEDTYHAAIESLRQEASPVTISTKGGDEPCQQPALTAEESTISTSRAHSSTLASNAPQPYVQPAGLGATPETKGESETPVIPAELQKLLDETPPVTELQLQRLAKYGVLQPETKEAWEDSDGLKAETRALIMRDHCSWMETERNELRKRNEEWAESFQRVQGYLIGEREDKKSALAAHYKAEAELKVAREDTKRVDYLATELGNGLLPPLVEIANKMHALNGDIRKAIDARKEAR